MDNRRKMPHYHYIITGAGAAGLSLLIRMIRNGNFRHKKILLIDRAPKAGNDRTWCYWEKEKGFFDDIVHTRYQQLWFHANGYSALHHILPYQYKLIRSADFYSYCFDEISRHSNIELLYGNVDALQSDATTTRAIVNGETYTADYIFNSILFEKPVMGEGEFYLLQHFKGWIIETASSVFNPSEATLMDFRIAQQHGTTFVYVMPFAENRALVEYTLFSSSLLNEQDYVEGLKEYISRYLKVTDYQIIEEESGVIPMTNFSFPKYTNHIVHIGTAGGQTKASSGYTFRFIQKQSDKIIASLLRNGQPFYEDDVLKRRFGFYDSTLLNILANKKLPGDQIFIELFQKNKMTDVLRFLDNETTISEELRLITVLPKKAFIRSAFEQLFK